MIYDLQEQRNCVVRELRMRRKVYPGLVARGKMTESTASHEIAIMEAVLATVNKLLVDQQQMPLFMERP